MTQARRLLILVTALLLANASAWAQTSIEAIYRQGRAQGVPEAKRGTLEITPADILQFTWDRGSWKLPFSQIKTIYVSLTRRPESGALVLMPGVGPKRKLLLSLLFTDEQGANRNAVFFLPAPPGREFLQALENKTGRRVIYETEEARRASAPEPSAVK